MRMLELQKLTNVIGTVKTQQFSIAKNAILTIVKCAMKLFTNMLTRSHTKE